MPTALAIGIDLAWSEHRPSAGCAVDPSGTVVAEAQLGGDADILRWIDALEPGPAVVAIDAPLQVPNRTGRRRCEAEVAAAYGARHAGPHPANRTLLLGRDGRIRGEHLNAALERRGYRGPWDGRSHTVLEVFPHPALVEMFELPRRLPYKRGPVHERRRGLRRLRSLLATLEHADPSLRGPHVPVPYTARGAGLKAIEDRLDARICAWTALVWLMSGRQRVRVFGDRRGGHIAVPIGPASHPLSGA